VSSWSTGAWSGGSFTFGYFREQIHLEHISENRGMLCHGGIDRPDGLKLGFITLDPFWKDVPSCSGPKATR
jgi:hypothetical protein